MRKRKRGEKNRLRKETAETHAIADGRPNAGAKRENGAAARDCIDTIHALLILIMAAN